ncbi:hypothetical protein FB107DRAFT_291702 [Schizophyllum commune]
MAEHAGPPSQAIAQPESPRGRGTKRKSAPSFLKDWSDCSSDGGGSIFGSAACSVIGGAKKVTKKLLKKVRQMKPRKSRRKGEKEEELAYSQVMETAANATSKVQGTPIGHQHRYRRIPEFTYETVARVQPGGARCPISLMDNSMRLLQLVHIVSRATDMSISERLACILGLERDHFNSGTSANLLFMQRELHVAFDSDRFILVPSWHILRAIQSAIFNHGIPDLQYHSAEHGINAKVRRRRVNRAGYVHHEEVFTRHFARGYRIVPLNGMWSPDEPITRDPLDNDPDDPSDLDGDVYEWPFTGDDELPMIFLHNSPQLVVWKSYTAIKAQREKESSSKDGGLKKDTSIDDTDDREDDDEALVTGTDGRADDAVAPVTAQDFVQHKLTAIYEIGLYIEKNLHLPSNFLQSPGPRRPSEQTLAEDLPDDDVLVSDEEVVTDGMTRSLHEALSDAADPEL